MSVNYYLDINYLIIRYLFYVEIKILFNNLQLKELAN